MSATYTTRLKAVQLKGTLEEQLDSTKKIDEDILNLFVQVEGVTDDEITEEVKLAGDMRGEINALVIMLTDLLTNRAETPPAILELVFLAFKAMMKTPRFE